jgi:class 3 adenylate cyclase
VEEEEKNKAIDEAKQKQLQTLVKNLDTAKAKASELLSQMLPTSVSKQLLNGNKVAPQYYESATVLFMDVVGFDTITSQIHPLETVSLLNDLYRTVDKVIEKYDVYKVETVGDTYMCVSGVPKANTTHAVETATMALHLLHQISKFEFREHPDIKINVRIGINSGPLVTGVIGTKMPRYCLFGDTVNTASRMESNSQGMKIHVSASTYELLAKSNLFTCQERGEIEVKGKGKMKTYWVQSKKDFDPSFVV